VSYCRYVRNVNQINKKTMKTNHHITQNQKEVLAFIAFMTVAIATYLILLQAGAIHFNQMKK
jgi:hypothetical protein